MKKVSVYFTDPQSAALDSKASQAGITFAEALRRALDEWLTQQQHGGSMTDEQSPTTTTPAVSVAFVQVGTDDYARSWRNATIEEDYDGNLEVYRGERKIAYFSKYDVRSWWIEEPEDQ